jgi:cobalt-zinc-cadmium efflux system protein
MPAEIAHDLKRAKRLEYWTLFWIGSIVVAMFFVTGSSQAMRSAWIEDILSLIPAIVFLIGSRIERRPPSRAFPFGFHRVQSLGFLISAVALSFVGAFLLYEAVTTLIRQEHVTIPPTRILGREIWLGWLMIAVLLYSAIPPMILGRIKQPVARRLNDRVLHTDAMMQKADWMTGLAGIAGVIGIGFGLWWADAVAAGVISGSILSDGIGALRAATAELNDGAPRALEGNATSAEADALAARLEAEFPGAKVRLRETGRFIHAELKGVAPPRAGIDLRRLWPGAPERAWRFEQLSFVAAEAGEERVTDAGAEAPASDQQRTPRPPGSA